MASQWIFRASCIDQPGIVAAVSTKLHETGFFIEEAAQFGDSETNRFFMRLKMRNVNSDIEGILRAQFTPIAERFEMDWELLNTATKPKILLMVSKFEHCLSDLLYRYRTGELDAEITGIVSNHETLRHLGERAGIPFHHIAVTKATKPEAEAKLDAIIKSTDTELIVLARYMQILSEDMCSRYPAQIINIHHSFLPSFKGAKPYHRAHARGVKLIGATAHYVTPDLDEGPIIEQSVERIDHSKSANDLVLLGKDVECRALAKAVKMHIERRVFLNGIRTVAFT